MPQLSGLPTKLEISIESKWSSVTLRGSFATFSTEQLVSQLCLTRSTLQHRRNQAKLHMFYKIINNLISVPHDHLSQTSRTTRGHSMRYIQLAVRTNTYLHSFFPSTIRLWNSLPKEIALSPNFDRFKLLLDTYLCFVRISVHCIAHT